MAYGRDRQPVDALVHFAAATGPAGQPPKHALSPLGCILWLITGLVILGFLGQVLGS